MNRINVKKWMNKNCINRPRHRKTFVTIPCPTLTDKKLGFKKRPKKRLEVSQSVCQLFMHIFSVQSFPKFCPGSYFTNFTVNSRSFEFKILFESVFEIKLYRSDLLKSFVGGGDDWYNFLFIRAYCFCNWTAWGS